MTSWPVKRLGDVCAFVRGVTYSKGDARSEANSGLIPLLRATNITEKGLLQEDLVFVPNELVRDDQKLKSGDLLITISSGSASVVGRSVLVENPGEATFGAFCGVLRPSSQVNPKYLAHLISSRVIRATWSEAAQGTNINNLKRDDILQTELLLPPLNEQKRLVALLDAVISRVDELTECYEQAHNYADSLFTKSLDSLMLKDDIDYEVSTLKEIATKIGSGATPSGGQASYKDSGIPLIRSMNVHDSKFEFEGLVYLDDVQAGRLDGVVVEDGDVLLNITGASLTRTCLAPKEILPARVNQHVAIVRAKKENVYGRYLQLFLVCDRTKSLLWEIGGAAGATRQALTKKDLENLLITYPRDLETQSAVIQVAEMLANNVYEYVSLVNKKLQFAKELRQSVLEAAFRGEL